MNPFKITLAVAMVALAGSNPSSCLAQNSTWNVDADGIWSTATNWVGGIIANGVGNSADFSAVPITAERSVVLDSNRTLGSLDIGETNLSYFYENFVSTNGSVLTLNNGANTPVLASSGYRQFYIPIAGSSGVDFTNPVSTTLGSVLGIFGSNTYSGVTTIESNVVIYPQSTNAFGGTADGTVVKVGGSIYLVGTSYPTAEPLTLSGNGFGGDGQGALHGGGGDPRTYSGNIISSQSNQGTIGVDTGGTLILTGTLTGGNSAFTEKSGGGTLVLAGNVPALSPFVSSGVLQIGNGGTTGNLVDNAYYGNYGTIAFNRSDTYTWSPTTYVGGNGTIWAMGPGALIINSYEPFHGDNLSDPPQQALLVGPGAVAQTATFIPINSLTLNGGTLSATGGNNYARQNWALWNTVNVMSNALSSVISCTGTDGDGSENGIQILDAPNGTTFNVASGATNGIDLYVPAVLIHSYWDYGNFGTLVKTGPGTMELTAANLYQGGTTISGGMLLVNNTSGSGTGTGGVTVQGGATLGGNGTISGTVTIQPGGTLAPGMPIGVLTIGGNLTLQGTTILEIDKSTPATNDLLVVAGAMSLGGNLVVTNAGPNLTVGDRFVLLSQVGIGSFDNVTLAPLHGGLGWVNNLASDGSVSVYQAVNPTPTTMTAQFVSGNLNLSWPADHIGWQLEVQTNPLNVGLSSNWTVVAGSTSVNSVSLPVSSGNPTVFYRLALP
ncbi:autotransporter-associated beta strand repeat-containing protein [Pedosphaera parvula]|uniref:Autotransporter-associated beta strand repeat protein n=1 Tax=Pedosphaera parvula (strain Ellin514) TaxID=320771 RepID=B9XJ44_PEDPL|nr:autotransporter-associated beta strand repeat-containing protein [Pedosphaera parvula]EEF60082.1 autotransporter-associated beta strand repeat protein [Pedosphaera parvula Ellin514]